MNRIVREHYPVSKLPEDLREGFGSDDEVRVTIDASEPGDTVAARRGPIQLERAVAADQERSPKVDLSKLKTNRRSTYRSVDEILRHVRGLRDEWIDRER